MNIAIPVTCLLIEASESGVELKVGGESLKIKTGTCCNAELRGRLKEYRSAIIERLNHEADNPDLFRDFIEQHCLFFAGDGMATPKGQMAKAYQCWADHNNRQVLSLVTLDKRLRVLGCEEILVQSAPWWEHVGLWWPASEAPSDAELVLE